MATTAFGADTKADWRHMPTREELLAVWPRAAMEKGVSGKAVIACKISLQGALYDCEVASETPPGMGFGGAAIALSPQFLMKPATHDGQPVTGGGVRIPVDFDAEEPPTGTNIPGGEAGDRVVTNVPWVEAPTYTQVILAYPAKARDKKVGGHAALDCHFNGQGRLAGCSVIVEDPKGFGFGSAAKALARDFVAPRTDGAGESLKNVSTQIPFTFAAEMLTDPTPVIGKPIWTRLPGSGDMAAGFPAAATAAHVSTGHVTIACDIGQAGRLVDCSVQRAEPQGLDFDKAAMALAADFQTSIWTSEGLPTVGGRIRVPIRYEAGPPGEAPPKPPSP
ncbi:MAG TPA: TonB family protein [Caulobacteraceae bacterium]